VSILLGLLPLAALTLAWLALANARPQWDWDRSLLRAVVYTAAYAVAAAELLGLVHALTQGSLVAVWLAPIVVLGVRLGRAARAGRLRRPRLDRPRGGAEWVMALVLVGVLALTGLAAFLAPPNTWDSLSYHMARVAHWAQNGSLNHYASGIERQNLMPPGAEIGVLHAYLLAMGDRLANFPQWLAMAACLVGVGATARLLGATRIGQLAAAVFAATLPMGIAQSASTMTDYVVAVWVLVATYETVLLAIQPRDVKPEIVPMALAAGLAILTKPTAFAFLAPLAVVVAVVLIRRRGVAALLVSAALALFLVLAVNAGYFGRNLATYGNLLGSRGKLDTHANEIMDARVVVSNLMRNASLHAGTPWEAVNSVVFRGVLWTHIKIGIDPTDPRTTIHEGFQVRYAAADEKRAGNPFHAALAIVALALLLVWVARGRQEARPSLLLLLLAGTSFILLSIMIQFSVFASRYHLPFFVMAAPAVGYVAGRCRSAWIIAGLAVGLMLTSLSTLLRLQERPLLEDRNGYGLFSSPRSSLYFMTGHGLEDPYRAVADRIARAGCSSVGVMLSGDAAEYPLWPLLGAPRADLDVQWIVAGTPSARYADESFEPCAVVCDGSCPDEWTHVRDLPLALQVSPLRLYLSP
jgi:hypothetical protein